MQANVTDNEQWLPMPGFEAAYDVSSCGRVRRSVDSRYKRRGALISQRIGRVGYPIVNLYPIPGREYSREVHRLVALVFLHREPCMTEVNHLDGCKTNNMLANLEWTTSSGNHLHAVRLGLNRPPRGEANAKAKLTEADVLEIRSIGYAESQTTLAARYGVSRGTIAYIRLRLSWRHI